eukprot:4141486-Amphidinium_carterae.1
MDVVVEGRVDEKHLQQLLASGVQIGTATFGQELRYGNIRSARQRPGTDLHSAQAEMTLSTPVWQGRVQEMLKVCGHRLLNLKRTEIGNIKLDDMKPGELKAASAEEEDWMRERLGQGMYDEEFISTR